jgi:hypothetical protein
VTWPAPQPESCEAELLASLEDTDAALTELR